MKMPLAQSAMNSCQDRRRPSLSVRVRAIKDPNAAPRTPNEEMLAVRLARPEGLFFHREAVRSKSFLKDFKPMEALNPPSS